MPAQLRVARTQIPVGTPREEAIRVLEQKAWYSQPCQRIEESITDLFFFGSREFDKAELVTVRSVQEGAQYKVDRIGHLEPSAWQAAYADCIQRDKFDQ